MIGQTCQTVGPSVGVPRDRPLPTTAATPRLSPSSSKLYPLSPAPCCVRPFVRLCDCGPRRPRSYAAPDIGFENSTNQL
ncbi:hypothetical protein SERLADRAFT_376803 [Serpula lacrymans var. lacrymans S7.9]|uniref:Uncharacterized protein n=1 Tax=Serpula lacrymans var. lacrymans (strain S7.9) TaxID=578457 RepID=F8NEX3_SERL9|nr:uncharacterized protein SERLADRAFT_376803 [Serpula lacrymans var. lacrymans S7.9]EGO31121.1 hypothetical protein SERLADRAFT_376803 [Serpula lacrymans var. lacrymans S7.9]